MIASAMSKIGWGVEVGGAWGDGVRAGVGRWGASYDLLIAETNRKSGDVRTSN